MMTMKMKVCCDCVGEYADYNDPAIVFMLLLVILLLDGMCLIEVVI